MRINVYKRDNEERPLRQRKWVQTVEEARRFCNWLARQTGENPGRIYFVITR